MTDEDAAAAVADEATEAATGLFLSTGHSWAARFEAGGSEFASPLLLVSAERLRCTPAAEVAAGTGGVGSAVSIGCVICESICAAAAAEAATAADVGGGGDASTGTSQTGATKVQSSWL